MASTASANTTRVYGTLLASLTRWRNI